MLRSFESDVGGISWNDGKFDNCSICFVIPWLCCSSEVSHHRMMKYDRSTVRVIKKTATMDNGKSHVKRLFQYPSCRCRRHDGFAEELLLVTILVEDLR
jgi:hypothetical protein